ncbi:hypothetical protein GZ22_18165 (plasmid) [Terribacillus saccharophilus]|uniref:Uncharacterized protein n=1 Tax=Terribacillus saccharophilus TaxID=361277 RepID=A0A075LQT8_9BACI|nr:hypothetical protein [Terribacillus goriensis]AIF68367.1 hypothetical protein GZ22_18165 [Terribacillus goriensis]
MPELSVFLIIFVMSAIQYLMATRSSFIFGFIIPIVFVAVMSWMFTTNRIESVTMFVVLLIIGLILLIEEWVRGRRSLQKRRKKEMDIMKTKDL